MNIKVFAKGYNIYKLIWIFMSCSFIGSIVEIVWCYFTMHRLMSRSSLLYGQFSVVWGFGCVLLTILLHRMEGKRDLSVFIVGAFAGGVYEYICSLLTEGLFGVRFWDYSHIPFNVDGRINLLFCFFWGIIAVLWVQNIYPYLSKKIESIPFRYGKLLTWICVTLLAFDMLLSASALMRSYQRHQNIPPQTVIAEYLDDHYPDEYLTQRYQNMSIKK